MIRNVKAYPAFNSKGEPTIRIKAETTSGFFSSVVPAGTSKGTREVVELPQGKAMESFNTIRKNFIGLDETDWLTSDKLLIQIDGTENMKRVGGNVSLGISLAIARAGLWGELWRLGGSRNKYLFPYPLGNVVGGGSHGGKTSWQEFLVIPRRAKSPEEASQINFDIWKTVGEELKSKGVLIGKNIENAWIADLDDLATLDLIHSTAEEWGAFVGIDFAASGFWDGKKYIYKSMKKQLSPQGHYNFIEEVVKSYGLYYAEDPFHENDPESFRTLTAAYPKTLVTGDDLYCTNPEMVRKGVEGKWTNGVIIKPNQIGTLLRAQETIEALLGTHVSPVASHRSGETEDPFISDLAVAWSCPLIKIGNLGPDLPKHNRLAELWHDVPEGHMAELP